MPLGGVFLAIFRGVEDPNEITFLQDFNSLQEAKAFAASPEFKSTMDKGRVKGTPQIWYASKAIQ
jgi:heme-degrading monooxygenase HmoA